MAPTALTLRQLDELAAAGFLDAEGVAPLGAVAERYAIALPPALAALIDKSDPNDPIAKQFVPDARESETVEGDDPDPIGDGLKSPVKGLVHRYPDRVLIKPIAACAVYCRFCFRREMVGPGAEAMSDGDWGAALSYIAARPEIWEVILTGGDPLFQSERRLAETTRRLAAIPHVKVLRWHTRLPVAAPERVNTTLAKALTAGHDKTVVVAVHANHSRELTQEARAAIQRLRKAGVMLISQSVLLRGVNDDAATLEALMRAFVEAGVKPYYLHHADRAPGTAHLRTTLARGQALMAALKARLSRLAMPTYVLDLPGAFGKVDATSAQREGASALYRVKDRFGVEHVYEDMIVGEVRSAVRGEHGAQRSSAVNF
jgi:lysine 2,3-aminomutase